MNFSAMRTHRDRARLGILIGLLFILVSSPVLSSDDQGWIPFSVRGGHIVLDAKVNGHPARAILDSGATLGAVSEGFAEQADIETDGRQEIRVLGVYGDRRVFGSHRFNLELGEQEISVAGLPVVPGDGFDLLLGRPMFDHGIVQIDYPNERVRFLRAGSVDFESNVNVRRDREGQILVEATINDQSALLLFDTGNSGVTLLTHQFVRRHDLDEFEVPAAHVHGRGIVESGDINLLRLDSARIGPFPFDGFLAGYLPEAKGWLDGQRPVPGTRIRQRHVNFDGMLGYEVLHNFLVTIDFSNARLHLHLP